MRDIQRSFEEKIVEGADLPFEEAEDETSSLKESFLEAATNQIRDYPPTAEAYRRLLSEGIPEDTALILIANLVARQVYWVMKTENAFDEKQYQEWLDNLPELPNED